MPTKKKPFPILFMDHMQIPVFKEKINLVFAQGGPYTAAKELDLLEPFANKYYEGNLGKATDYFKGANAMVFNVDNMLFIIFPYNVTRGVMAHEIFHLAVNILGHRGLEFSSDSEEAYAHTIDWLTDEIYSYYDKLMKKMAKHKAKK